jgi:hypothetical protein
MNNFSVIIPSRNESNLRACIGAIRAAGETCRVIVVWDGDPDSVWRPWPWDCGECEHMDGRKPFSWPRNVNLGILAAGEDDVIICGDDTILKTPGGFSAMASLANAPMVGMLSAACNGVGNINQTQRPYSPVPGVGHWYRPEPRMLCMVCCFIPRRVINTVGMLDQRFNSYACADDDLSYRIRQAGFNLGVLDGCFVDHETLPSTFRAPGMDSSLEHGKRMFREKWGISNDET